MYNAVNDGVPTISLGSSATERLEIKANYASGTQEVNQAIFTTYTDSTTSNRGRFQFLCQQQGIMTIWDAGISMSPGKGFQINGTDIITDDGGGTATLSNIDAIDATTTTTLSTALVPNASDSVKGVVELATTAETTTGTDTSRAVTPDGLKDGYQGSTNVTTVGTIGTGRWQGTAIAHTYIGADAIEGDNIADNAVDSEHYTDDSIDTAHIADDAVTFAKASGVTPNVYGSIIKVLPSDFMANEEPGVTKTLQFVDNSASGIKPGDNNTELLAFVSIPEGMKATHVDVYADANLVFSVYEFNIHESVGDISAASKGTGACNTTLDITHVNATATNYLLIQVVTVAKADRVWGAKVTIATQ